MTKPTIHVSDHAVLRYLERVGGFEIEALRQDLAKRCEPAARTGASSVTIGGFAFMIESNVVVTVLPKKEGQARRPTRRAAGPV
jgi:hypothetical protein